MVVFSVSGAAMHFGCYAYDDALKLEFGKTYRNLTYVDVNGTNTSVIEGTAKVPAEVELVFNILRFTCLVHIYYAMWFFLFVNIIVFGTLVYTQKAFNST